MYNEVLSIASVVGAVVFQHAVVEKTSSADKLRIRIDFLINELTMTKVRQQAALDELMLLKGAKTPYLFKHLDNESALANREVRLLNTFPEPFEIYNDTESYFVGELATLLLCWNTKVCEQDHNIYDDASRLRQRDLLLRWCRAHYLDVEKYCMPAQIGVKKIIKGRVFP